MFCVEYIEKIYLQLPARVPGREHLFNDSISLHAEGLHTNKLLILFLMSMLD